MMKANVEHLEISEQRLLASEESRLCEQTLMIVPHIGMAISTGIQQCSYHPVMAL